MSVVVATVATVQAFVDHTSDLVRELRTIAVLLIHEAEALPGWRTISGRPHEHGRNRYSPRYSRTGSRIPGLNRVRPDCPRPVRGQCACPPDGSWRPVGGAIRADALTNGLAFVPNAGIREKDGTMSGVWVESSYLQGPDGLWRCDRPMRRAMERLRGESLRRFLVLTRLLDGDTVDEAWAGLGRPDDPVEGALAICRQVERLAAEEATAEYEKRPRRWRSIPWVELSESQQAAMTAGEVASA